MMGDDLFLQCQTTYEDIRRLLKSIVGRVVRQYNVMELSEELESQGWLIAVESLKQFDPLRNVKATTFVYAQVYGRLLRLARMHHKQRQAREAMSDSFALTDNSKDLMAFEPNPYRMQPDVLYDINRRRRMVSALHGKHRKDIHEYLAAEEMRGDATVRQRASRQRRKSLERIRETCRHILAHGTTQSGSFNLTDNS